MQPSTITYYVAVSLDGFIAAPDGSFDQFIDDPVFNAAMFEKLQSDFDAVIMGRATYEVGVRAGVTDPYPWLRTFVVTTSYHDPPDPNVTLLRSIEEVRALKESSVHGRIWLCGGGALAADLLREGLIDRLELKTHPVMFGAGVPLFRSPGFVPTVLERMAERKSWESGIVVDSYEL